MLPEEYSVEVVLEAIDAMAPSLPKARPKVILFDIGGVCVSWLDFTFPIYHVHTSY